MVDEDYERRRTMFAAMDDGKKNQHFSEMAHEIYGIPQVMIDSQLSFLAKVDPAYSMGVTMALADIDEVNGGSRAHTYATHLTRYRDAEADAGTMRNYLREVEAAGRLTALPTILNVATRTTGLRLAILAHVSDERWIACGVEDRLETGVARGLEMDVRSTLCHDVLQHGRPIVINDLAVDDRYRDHPVTQTLGFRSVISVPIVLPGGALFGTLSVLDPEPHVIDTPAMIASFELLGELVAYHLAAELELVEVQEMLAAERRVSERREQFIAVLGHDLRNPLASVAAGTRMLARRPEETDRIVGHINDSIGRMAGLIDEVLDFARGRLGGGLAIERVTDSELANTIEQVIQELRNAHPAHPIEVDLAVDAPIRCDAPRIAQLLSNLLGNALTHGAADQPIRVTARIEDAVFELCVENGGQPIPRQALAQLFEPFVRGTAGPSREGLGLGLYIASEIAKAHDGDLLVRSDGTGTCFTFRMPVSVQ